MQLYPSFSKIYAIWPCELFSSYDILREESAILFLFLMLRPGNSPLYFLASGYHTFPYLSAQAIEHLNCCFTQVSSFELLLMDPA